MANTTPSPAVQSRNKEQAEQRKKGSNDLQKGLEDTFPASDPVSVTHTAVAGHRDKSGDSAEAQRDLDDLDENYPLVNEALNAVNRRQDDDYEVSGDEIRALRSEVSRLREMTSEVVSGTARMAKAQTKDVIGSAEGRIRERPMMAVGIAALLGYLWGITR